MIVLVVWIAASVPIALALGGSLRTLRGAEVPPLDPAPTTARAALAPGGAGTTFAPRPCLAGPSRCSARRGERLFRPARTG